MRRFDFFFVAGPLVTTSLGVDSLHLQGWLSKKNDLL